MASNVIKVESKSFRDFNHAIEDAVRLSHKTDSHSERTARIQDIVEKALEHVALMPSDSLTQNRLLFSFEYLVPAGKPRETCIMEITIQGPKANLKILRVSCCFEDPIDVIEGLSMHGASEEKEIPDFLNVQGIPFHFTMHSMEGALGERDFHHEVALVVLEKALKKALEKSSGLQKALKNPKEALFDFYFLDANQKVLNLVIKVDPRNPHSYQIKTAYYLMDNVTRMRLHARSAVDLEAKKQKLWKL